MRQRVQGREQGSPNRWPFFFPGSRFVRAEIVANGQGEALRMLATGRSEIHPRQEERRASGTRSARGANRRCNSHPLQAKALAVGEQESGAHGASNPLRG